MLDGKKMKRLNELAQKKKQEALNAEEMVEQKLLREEYLKSFRKSFSDQLKNIEWTD